MVVPKVVPGGKRAHVHCGVQRIKFDDIFVLAVLVHGEFRIGILPSHARIFPNTQIEAAIAMARHGERGLDLTLLNLDEAFLDAEDGRIGPDGNGIFPIDDHVGSNRVELFRIDGYPRTVIRGFGGSSRLRIGIAGRKEHRKDRESTCKH